MHPLPAMSLVVSKPLEFGLGAFWNAYPSDQATELGIVTLALGLVFLYLGVRMKSRAFRVHQKIGGLAGLLVFITWALSAAVVIFFFDLLSSSGILVPSPVSPVTYTTAGITFVAILVSARLRTRTSVRAAFVSAFVGTVVGVMIFELPFLFMIAPQLGPSLQRSLWGESPLFSLVFASYSTLFLSPVARFSRYTLFSLGSMFVVLSIWAFLTNFSFPSDPVSLVLNSMSKILSFVSAFTLFFHREAATNT